MYGTPALGLDHRVVQRREHPATPRPEPLFNVFFALGADPNAAAQVVEERESLLRFRRRSAVGIVPPACLHLSLYPVGAWWRAVPASVLDALTRSLRHCDLRAVTIELDRVVHLSPDRNGPSAVALVSGKPTPALQALRARLAAAILHRPSLAFGGASFQPHVTLFREDGWFPDHAVPPISWKARELLLVKSHVGESRHDHLGRWWLPD